MSALKLSEKEVKELDGIVSEAYLVGRSDETDECSIDCYGCGESQSELVTAVERMIAKRLDRKGCLVMISGEPRLISVQPIESLSAAEERFKSEVAQHKADDVEMDEQGYWWDGEGEISSFAESGMHVTCQGGKLIELKKE